MSLYRKGRKMCTQKIEKGDSKFHLKIGTINKKLKLFGKLFIHYQFLHINLRPNKTFLNKIWFYQTSQDLSVILFEQTGNNIILIFVKKNNIILINLFPRVSRFYFASVPRNVLGYVTYIQIISMFKYIFYYI